MSSAIKILLVVFTLGSGVAAPSVAEACPMCQVANEDDKGDSQLARPRAYMYSILFMLAVPATMFTAFGVSFYRLAKQQNEPLDESLLAGDEAYEGTENDDDRDATSL